MNQATLNENGQHALATPSDAELCSQHSLATNGTTHVEAKYLEVIAYTYLRG